MGGWRLSSFLKEKLDFARHNDEVRSVMEAYHAGRPVRVPLMIHGSITNYFFNPELNTRKLSFESFFKDPLVQIDAQLHYACWRPAPPAVRSGDGPALRMATGRRPAKLLRCVLGGRAGVLRGGAIARHPADFCGGPRKALRHAGASARRGRVGRRRDRLHRRHGAVLQKPRFYGPSDRPPQGVSRRGMRRGYWTWRTSCAGPKISSTTCTTRTGTTKT